MKIDVFAHILPHRYLEALKSKAAPGFYLSNLIDACPPISDLDMRFRVMDMYEDYAQVLTLLQPPFQSLKMLP